MRSCAADGAMTMRQRLNAHATAGRHILLDAMSLQSCAELGFVSDAPNIGPDSLEFLGLEIWSRVFFSGKLTAPQLGSKSL